MQKQATFMHAPRTSHGGYDDAIEESATGGKAVKKGAKDGDDVSVWHVGWEWRDNIGVTEERFNWVTRLVSSTRLKHPLAA